MFNRSDEWASLMIIGYFDWLAIIIQTPMLLLQLGHVFVVGSGIILETKMIMIIIFVILTGIFLNFLGEEWSFRGVFILFLGKAVELVSERDAFWCFFALVIICHNKMYTITSWLIRSICSYSYHLSLDFLSSGRR